MNMMGEQEPTGHEYESAKYEREPALCDERGRAPGTNLSISIPYSSQIITKVWWEYMQQLVEIREL